MTGHGEAGRGDPPLQRSENSAGMDAGMRVLSYLIAGVALYGFLGWLGDHLLGTRFLLPVGIVVGAVLGCYLIIRRFGGVAGSSAAPGDSAALAEPAGDKGRAR